MELDIGGGVMNCIVVRLLWDVMLAAAGPYESIHLFMAPAEADGPARVCCW